MGKKGSWFSVIKKVFTSNSKEKPVNEAEKKSVKENKGKGRGRLKHGSFIPRFREPSSIEKILEEVDQQNLFIGHSHQPQPQQPSSSSGRPVSPPPAAAAAAASSPPPPPPPPPRLTTTQSSGAAASPPRPRSDVHPQTKISQRPEPTLQQQHHSATRIQAVYRGHMARRKARGLTGLVRLQGVVRGQNVKRQTVNAMKQMQLLVRVQTQIQSQRIQMLENQALLKQPNTNPHEQSEMGDEHWDDSLITKEEREARVKRKAEAVIKRERAMAYAYSQKLWKGTPTSGKTSETGGYPYPWWWKWLERQPPSQTQTPQKTHAQVTTPPDQKLNHKQQLDSPRSMAASRSTTPRNRMMKARGGKGGSPSPYPIKDDDSFMSCPPFSVPNYMSPTVSARAKARPTSNPRDRVATPSTPGSDSSKRRFSFPFTPNASNLHKSPRSVGDFSIDSANSVPSSVGRKPFNRFV